MKFGIYLPNYGPFGNARTIADLARDAESAGWNGFFVWDHIAERDETGASPPCADPWLALTAAALQTTSIKLGTTVTPLPRRRPHKLARETVTLDWLSNGRLILGVGIGQASRFNLTGSTIILSMYSFCRGHSNSRAFLYGWEAHGRRKLPSGEWPDGMACFLCLTYLGQSRNQFSRKQLLLCRLSANNSV